MTIPNYFFSLDAPDGNSLLSNHHIGPLLRLAGGEFWPQSCILHVSPQAAASIVAPLEEEGSISPHSTDLNSHERVVAECLRCLRKLTKFSEQEQ